MDLAGTREGHDRDVPQVWLRATGQETPIGHQYGGPGRKQGPYRHVQDRGTSRGHGRPSDPQRKDKQPRGPAAPEKGGIRPDPGGTEVLWHSFQGIRNALYGIQSKFKDLNQVFLNIFSVNFKSFQ